MNTASWDNFVTSPLRYGYITIILIYWIPSKLFKVPGHKHNKIDEKTLQNVRNGKQLATLILTISLMFPMWSALEQNVTI